MSDIVINGDLMINGSFNMNNINDYLDIIYPVGTIIIKSGNNPSSPAATLGGTWVRIKDAFIQGVPSGNTTSTSATNQTPPSGAGYMDIRVPSHKHGWREYYHNHTYPSHTHAYLTNHSTGGNNGFEYSSKANAWNRSTETANSDGWVESENIRFVDDNTSTSSFSTTTATNKNLPPYKVVYMWKRTE